MVILVGFVKVIVVVLFYVCECVSEFSCLSFAFMHWIRGSSLFSLSTNFTPSSTSSKQESILSLESKLWFFAPDTPFGLSVSKSYGIQSCKIFILVFKNVNRSSNYRNLNIWQIFFIFSYELIYSQWCIFNKCSTRSSKFSFFKLCSIQC